MQKISLAIVVVLGLAALGVAAQIYLAPTAGHAQPRTDPDSAVSRRSGLRSGHGSSLECRNPVVCAIMRALMGNRVRRADAGFASP